MSLRRTFRTIEVEKVRPNEYNPNRMSPALFDKLVEDIKNNGVLNPIHVVERNGEYIIIDGEHRYRAVKLLGFKTIDAFVYDGLDDDDFRRILSLRFNVLHGSIEVERFVEEYKGLIDKYGLEGFGDMIGFNEEIWRSLKNRVVKVLYDMGVPKEVVKQSVKKMNKKKTLDQIVAVVDEILKNYGSFEKLGFISVSSGVDFVYINVDKKLYDDFVSLLGRLASIGIKAEQLIERVVKFSDKIFPDIFNTNIS